MRERELKIARRTRVRKLKPLSRKQVRMKRTSMNIYMEIREMTMMRIWWFSSSSWWNSMCLSLVADIRIQHLKSSLSSHHPWVSTRCKAMITQELYRMSRVVIQSLLTLWAKIKNLLSVVRLALQVSYHHHPTKTWLLWSQTMQAWEDINLNLMPRLSSLQFSTLNSPLPSKIQRPIEAR